MWFCLSIICLSTSPKYTVPLTNPHKPFRKNAFFPAHYYVPDLMCKHRSPNQPSSADVSQPNQRCHPLPSLNCNGDTVFDFTDPNVSISAEAFLSALDSHSARSSPYPSSSTPATPTLSVSQVSSSSLLSDVSSNVLDRSTAKKPIAPNTKRSSLISVGITRSSSENQPDMELPMGRSSNSVNRFGAKNAPETVTCTCMPNGPVLCECAVQAVRIQRQLLRCRHQVSTFFIMVKPVY